MKSDKLVKAGRFKRILNGRGALLFSSYLRDSDFLLNVRHMFHFKFGTKFFIKNIKRKRGGFHVELKEVLNSRQASFLVGEVFGLPYGELAGKSVDLLTGRTVEYEGGGRAGTVSSVSPTPLHAVLNIKKDDGTVFSIPLQDVFVEVGKEKIILKKQGQFENAY